MFKIKINNREIKLLNSFSINKDLNNFVDTFNINIWNPWGIYSRTIPVWAYINVYYNNIEIFRGVCEKKDVNIWNVWFDLSFSGREEMLLLTEDDINPLKKDYEKVSDNFIIKDVTKWYWWEYELWAEKLINEYKISNNWVRKWSVLNNIVSRNNFYLFKIWNTLYKKLLPSESDYTVRNSPQFTLATQGGGFVGYNNRILDIKISENISWCKSTIKGFTYGASNTKPKIVSELENTSLSTWIYPQRLRNISNAPLTAPVIKRFVSNSVDVKSKAELDWLLKKTRIDQDIQIEVNITIAEFLDLHILDTCEVFIQDEDIKQYMYIKALSYNYDKTNKFYTSYTFSPIIPVELE